MRIKLICLAKSWKNNHYCVAGKEIHSNGKIGSWIRPVHPIFDSVPAEDFPYGVGDIVSLDLAGKQNDSWQPENHILAQKANIQLEGHISHEDLMRLIDQPMEIWGKGVQSSQGVNDRVPENVLSTLDHTLLFIFIERAIIWKKQSTWDDTCKLRLNFKFVNEKYSLAITDPAILDEYNNSLAPNEHKVINNCFVTLSLGLPYYGYSYKLVASIFYV